MIVTINCGSSSIKFTLFPADGELRANTILCKGQIDGLGDEPRFIAFDAAGNQFADERLEAGVSHEDALNFLRRSLQQRFSDRRLVAAGHRVVHGGTKYNAPVIVDEEVLADLEELVSLAPLHEPHNIAAIKAVAKLEPTIPQVACFDTAFHCTQPPVATLFAIPRQHTEAGIRRYGFHGLSYEYIASVLPDYAGPSAERQSSRRPPRAGRQYVRYGGTQQCCHDDGIHRRRWSPYGSSLWRFGSRSHALSHRSERNECCGCNRPAL